MDGLSAAASVIAVIQISSEIFDLCRTYYLNIKEARQDIDRLRNEVASLQDVLVHVVDLTNDPNACSLRTLNLINREDGPLKQCQLELEELATKLDPGDGANKMTLALRALKWPFKSKEIDKALISIGRYKASVVLSLTTDQITLSRAMGRDLSEIKIQLETQKFDGDREAVIHWLATTDPSTNYHASCKKCQPETGKWFAERNDFKEWGVTPNSLLWIYGIPGCGKTILSSTIIQQLQQHCSSRPQNAVAYFYFDFKTTTKQEVSACISSIISQLCAQTRSLPAYIRQTYERSSHGKLQASISELKEMFWKVIEELDHVFIVIDALDECPKNEGREQLLAVITDIHSRSLDNIHVLVTSRREPDIEETLLPLLRTPAISLQGSHVDLDIKLHISSQLSTDPKLKKWPDEIKEEIESALISGANGMFRWVFCQLEALKRCLKASLIRQALRNLPRTLDETYTRLFLDIDPNYQQDAKYALAWLAFSGRPLQLAELAEAIAIDPTSNRPFDPEERFPDPESVFHILSSLITVSSDENWDQAFDSPDTFGSAVTVQLAHFSVKEYLVSDRILESPARYFAASTSVAQRFISECCLIYILQYVFTPLTKDSTQFVTFPLLDYASAYWYMHLSLVAPEQQQSLNPLAIRLLLDNSALRSWLQIHTPLQTSIMGVGRLEEVESPLVYASDMGLFSVTRQLLADGCDPNESCRDPPLHLAARRGHENVVALLLDYGAKINVKNIEGHTPLHSAVQYEGNISVVQILLNHGADVNTANNHGSTPLFSAVYGDHGDIARLLVERGARVEDSDNEMHQTPLHRAAWNEDGPLLDFLLKHGANINAKNIRGETALHYAAKYGQNTLSQLLVNGADPNIQADNGETPLYWAVNNGQKQAVELLVNAGARIDFQVLSLAEEAFHSVFHLLLSACSASAESAAAIQMVFEGSKLRGYWLCQECPFMLSNRPERAGDVVLPFRTSDERGTIPQAEVIWVGLAKM